MSDIFLSYKREDKTKAQIITEIFEQMGYSVWWDPKIDYGEVFDEVIQKELDTAKCVVVIWSEKSVKSEWVRAEATSGKNRLFPILIEDVNIPVPFNLFHSANLIEWDGDQSHPEFSRLVESISKKLGHPTVSEMEIKNSPIDELNEKEIPDSYKELDAKVKKIIKDQLTEIGNLR